MALSKLDIMWQLMSKYKFYFCEDSAHKDLRCVICKNVLVNAVLSNVCHCHYCYDCISLYINDIEKYCPGDTKYCKDEHISIGVNAIKNSYLNRLVSKLSTKCPNQSCGCNVELIGMEDHLRLCTKDSMKCPFVVLGCTNERSTKDEIFTHISDDIMHHSQLLLELIISLKNEITGLKDKYAEYQLEIDYLKEQLLDKEVKILKLQSDMEINERLQNAAIGNHVDDLKNVVKEGFENKNLEVSSLKEELEKKENSIMDLKEKLIEIRNEVEIKVNVAEFEEKIKHIEDQYVAQSVIDLRKDVDKMKEDIGRMMEERKTYEDERKMFTLYKDANFVWRIDEISSKINKFMLSESFYSNNYNLRLAILINGNSNLELFCYITKGDNDDKVVWPLTRAVTMNIIDQNTLKPHQSETFQCVFNRTNGERGNGFGNLNFIQYSSIKDKSSVIANDSILLSCNQ